MESFGKFLWILLITVTLTKGLKVDSFLLIAQNSTNNTSPIAHRDSRTLNRQFVNQPSGIITSTNPTSFTSSSSDDCSTKSGLNGLCMRRIECMRNGGTASGFCGTFGVCCEMNLQCNSISKLKRTIIRNPSTLPRRCTYHFQPYSTNVCQLRIDFDMALAQPTFPDDMNGLKSVSCLLDEFLVGDIVLCGTNSKQHIYLPFDTTDGISDVALTFKLADRKQKPTITGSWNMIVTQLECPPTTNRRFSLLRFTQQNSLQDLKTFLRPQSSDIDLLAPPGCLQYFTERQGTFESFNYNNGDGPYMANMRYGICFKRTALDTGVQLSAGFYEIGAATDTNNFIDNDCHDAVGTTDRSSDYLVIPESILATTPTTYGTFYCGTSLQGNDLLHAPPGPFAIYFMSDNIFSTLVPESGFKINYMVQ